MSKKEKGKNFIECVSEEVNNQKYVKFLNYCDRMISSNLREAGTGTRAASSNGLWCCVILPAVMLVYSMLCEVSPTYKIVTYTSLGLALYCGLFVAFLTVSCLVLQDQVAGGCIASGLLSALLLYLFVLKDLFLSLLFTLPSVFAFSYILRMSITKFPRTFTVGEAMVVAQGIVMFLVMFVAGTLDHTVDDEQALVTGVVFTALSTVAIIVTVLSVTCDSQRNLQYLTHTVIGGLLCGVVLLHLVLGINSVIQTLTYIFGTGKRIKLFMFWLAITLTTVVVLSLRTKVGVKANTVTRKSFHLLASTVFLSGTLCDRQLMTMAAGCGLALLILVEALRKSGIDPVSSTLQSAFEVYSDEKDGGTFAMTPFYLYCGLACPLLLVPHDDSGAQLELLSGVLAIGVGDTAASWFGSKYGYNKWPGSGKSLEGTAFNILSQITTIIVLQLFNVIDAKNALIRTAVAATISGFAEALTVQVDNLMLPIVTILAFQITWPLR